MSKKSGIKRSRSLDRSTFRRFGDRSPSPPLFFDEYGKTRRRAEQWDRDEDLINMWKNKLDEPAEAPKPKPKPVPKKPEVQVEDPSKKLLVENVNLNIPDNVKECRTSVYECTEDRDDENDIPKPAELVLRRGQSFRITITFDRPYSKAKHDLKLQFEIGKNPNIRKGTKAVIIMDEDGPKKYNRCQWGAYLESQSGNDVIVNVYVPATCIVGEWKFTILTICEVKDKTGKIKKTIFQYKNEDDIAILFNPWCKDDEVYMEESEYLNEYILNESSCVWRGSYYNFSPKPWELGQFNDGVLDACMFLLRKAFNKKVSRGMADPVKVARKMASIINSINNLGVLEGNWSGDYSGGTSPTTWGSSEHILKQYMKTGTVKYGQCWVFACVTTAVFRCLGIPARTVTNFSSAHDTNETCVVEQLYDAEGERIYRGGMNDSIWNFHVWNEVWMTRDDIGKKEFDGWQAVDATPQEESEGIMTCGPCPVYAVKHGMINENYDTAFVFAEVNSDVVKFDVAEDGTITRRSLDKTTVGRNISTKKPDGKEFNVFDYNNRLDLTDTYKFPEGSAEERAAVTRAYKYAKIHDEEYVPYKTHEIEQNIEMKLKHKNDLMIGKEIELEMKLKNQGTVKREVSSASIKLAPEAYTGDIGKAFCRKRFEPFSLDPHEEKSFKTVVTFEDYFKHLIEQANINIEAMCKVAPAQGDGPHETVTKTHNFTFSRPVLKVQGPKKGKVGEEVKFKVTFTNPLPVKLTNCDMSMNGSGFKYTDDKALVDIAAKGDYSEEFRVTLKRKWKRTIVFTFQSKELEDITGSTSLDIL